MRSVHIISRCIQSVSYTHLDVYKRQVEKGLGERKINYKLRDWVFSRQRYWEMCIRDRY